MRSDSTVSYRTKKAVQKAVAEGISIVLASGRTPAAMEKFVKTLGMNKRSGYLICNNGSLIMESCTNAVVYEA
ncbi:MAG: HAD hydrolase family protein, partial [Treponema sp.]|nr:HAD hydrolase family protein [Treponema sp.]